MKIKFGVSLVGLHISMRKVFKLANAVWRDAGQELVVTAGTEYVEQLTAADDDNGAAKMIHSSASFHPFGRAVDLRTRYFTEEVKAEVALQLQLELGNDYDVVVHKTHIHVEYDPPEPMNMKLFLSSWPHGTLELVEVIGPHASLPNCLYIKKRNGKTDTTSLEFLFDLPY